MKVLIITLILLYFMTRPKTVYQVAYDLGTHFLDSIEIMPNYAVMFDIDDTLISSNGKPIKPIIKLLKECLFSIRNLMDFFMDFKCTIVIEI